MLKAEHIKKSFGGIVAVDDCSFSIESRTITALIGPNGAGKTTLFNCISGIDPLDDGRIFFRTDVMNEWLVHERADAGIARTFQAPRVFKNLSVYDNVALATLSRDQYLLPSFFGFVRLDREEKEKIEAVLERVRLTHMKKTRAGDLSYGQQKLLSFARVLAQPHTLLLLDEPVAGVNPTIRQELIDLLLSLKRGGETIFMIEHDMHFVMDVADHVIVMNEGRILVEGIPAEIRRDPRVLDVYLGASLTK